jgi:autoinducer 2-degrading protein
MIEGGMYIVHIHIQVMAGDEEAFMEASLINAKSSVQEPGIARFDVLRETDDPARFLFIEVYRDTDAAVRHKETAHYAVWRDTVAGMMEAPRVAVKYGNLFPDDGGW